MRKTLLRFPSPPGIDHSLDARLRSAIATKRLIRFDYDGAVRVAEPHDYGLMKAVPRLFVYQLRKAGGVGRSATAWRLLFLSKIQNCVVLDDTFPGSRGDAHKHHYEWDVLYARVD